MMTPLWNFPLVATMTMVGFTSSEMVAEKLQVQQNQQNMLLDTAKDHDEDLDQVMKFFNRLEDVGSPGRGEGEDQYSGGEVDFSSIFQGNQGLGGFDIRMFNE